MDLLAQRGGSQEPKASFLVLHSQMTHPAGPGLRSLQLLVVLAPLSPLSILAASLFTSAVLRRKQLAFQAFSLIALFLLDTKNRFPLLCA